MVDAAKEDWRHTAVAGSAGIAESQFPAVWLRDNCPCAECRDPKSGQKFFGILDLPRDLAVARVQEAAGSVTVTFTPGGHRSTFSRDWLAEQCAPPPGDGRTEDDKELWQASDLDGRLPRGNWEAYLSDASERLRVLRAVQRLGFAVLHGTPVVEGTVLEVARSFGYVRETNYGALFDVRVTVDPSNLAFTGLAISPHTDNPYRDPVPTLQLLHCLSNAVDGGESGLVDGFYAASLLSKEDRKAFEVLTTTLVPFAWSDASNKLRAARPLIGLDPSARIREVRFNNRSMEALRFPGAELAAFYAAYRKFAEILHREEMQVTFRLEPGDCVIFDNVRLLHSRTAFADTGSGTRRLQGCYADMDGLASAVAVLGDA